MAVTQLMDAVAVEIEEVPTFEVGQGRARRALDDVETGGRQRLMQEIARILVEARARRVREAVAPCRPARRQIAVAFARSRLPGRRAGAVQGLVSGRSPASRSARSKITAWSSAMAVPQA
jgi:hypothetical protein